MWGEWIDTSEIVRKAARDKVFYATSGGGITLGGGDPVLQSDAAFAILKESKENGLNTAIETAGYYGFEKLSALLPYCDTLFFDIKAWDPMIHRRVAGGDPEMIKQNIGKTNAYIDAADRKPEWVIRLPILPGYNYRLWDFEPLAEFLKTFGNVTQVEIMPFHNFGVTKYEKLNRDYILKDNVNTQPEEVEDYLKVLIGHGLNAHIMSW
jgi:pyruvate formate lyase activating enzyme